MEVWQDGVRGSFGEGGLLGNGGGRGEDGEEAIIDVVLEAVTLRAAFR